MKKLLFTMLVALFATAVWGQKQPNVTENPVITVFAQPFNELPQCVKNDINKDYPSPKYILSSAQKVVTISWVVTTDPPPNQRKTFTVVTYEVGLKQMVLQGQTPSYVWKYLRYSSDCKTVNPISSLSVK